MLLQKCPIIKDSNLRSLYQYVKTHGDSKYQPRKPRRQHKRASRVKRTDMMLYPRTSNNRHQTNEEETLATNSR